MAKIDIARTQINTIKNATQVGENTASRVGEAMDAIVNVFDDYAAKAEFDELAADMARELNELAADMTYQPGDSLSPSATAPNWYLIGNGLSGSDQTLQMRKFAVNAGDVLYLKLSKDSGGVYQFQNATNVPSSGTNAGLVGTPVTTATDRFVIVPDGATYLIISELKTNTTNEVKSATRFTASELKEEMDELSTAVYGINRTYPLTSVGRYNAPADIFLKGGTTYTMRAKLAHTPSTYVVPELRNQSGTRVVDFGSLRDTNTKEVYYTPSEDITLYASIYVADGSTDAASVEINIFSGDTISIKVADIGSKFSFAASKTIGNAGRYDFAERFGLEAGKEYFFTAKLSDAPSSGYIAIELRDAGNNALTSPGSIRDSASHSATYTPTEDITNAFIYVYSSNNANNGIVASVKFGLVGTIDGEIAEESQQMDIVAANRDAAEKFRQLKRQPRIEGTTQGITPLVLMHYSDIHGSIENLQRIVQFHKAYKTLIDDVLNTGDTVFYENTDDFIVPMVTGASTQLLAIGNHDVKSGSSQITATACYARYIAPYVATWGVVQPSDAAANGKCYYYKDYTAAKVRLIVLDCMFWDSAQNTWLASTLADAKTHGLSVVCATHFAGGKVTPYDIAWNTLQYDDVSTVINADAPSTVQTFINDGGEFVCWLSGHGHFDMVGTLDDYPQQLNIAVDTANYGSPSAYSDIQRTRYTKSEDLLNAFSVDTFNKTIRLFRVGADRDAQLRHKGDLLIKYTTLQVLYSD